MITATNKPKPLIFLHTFLAIILCSSAVMGEEVKDESFKPSSISTQLRDFDAHYSANFTVTALVEKRNITKDSAETEALRYDAVITAAVPGETVLKAELQDDVKLPTYIEKGTSYGEYFYRGLRYEYLRPVSFFIHSTTNSFTKLKRLQRYTIGPSDIVPEQGHTDVLMLFEPISPMLDFDIYGPMLATGRCYTPYLDLESIRDIESVSETIVRCDASGRFPNPTHQPCDWEIEIDHKNDYLIRKAIAKYPNSSKVIARFETVGTYESNGSVYPKVGYFYPMPGRGLYKFDRPHVKVTIQSCGEDANLDLIEEVRTTCEPSIGVNVYDTRGDKKRLYTIGLNEPDDL